MKIRAFIAIPIPDEIKDELLSGLKLPGNFRIIKKENIHITLFFLGDTEESMIPEISRSVDKSIQQIKKFDLSIDSFGKFPERGIPRIIFFSGKEGKENLDLLTERIREELGKLGINDNKEFKYHITIARKNNSGVKQNFVLPELNKSYEFKVEKIILYKSELQRTGPVYSVILEKELP
jgi:RNA 2',3'-cyclic 3'-phosphodiesterase